MALTKDFGETVRERAQQDPKFRRALLQEAITLMLGGDNIETGRNLMRNYINATVGFPELAKETHIPKTSLMRMFGPAGNLFGVIAALQKREGVRLAVRMG